MSHFSPALILASATAWVSLASITVWTALSNAFTLSNVVSVVVLALSSFIGWRALSAKKQQVIDAQDQETLKSLSDGLKAATLRADAEKMRADQLQAMCATWEVKNAELVQSAIADQTRFLLSQKTLASRIQDLEKQLGK